MDYFKMEVIHEKQHAKDTNHARLRKLVRGFIDSGGLSCIVLTHGEMHEMKKLSNWKEKK